MKIHNLNRRAALPDVGHGAGGRAAPAEEQEQQQQQEPPPEGHRQDPA